MKPAQAKKLTDLIEDLVKAVLSDRPPTDASESWYSDDASRAKETLAEFLETL
jgi:hypothetical protein